MLAREPMSTEPRRAAGQSDYARVERAIRFLQAHAREQPDLATVAAEVGLSEFHFQRLFQRWAGVSPKRFLQVLTVNHAKQLLAGSRTVLETSYEVGLSAPSRLHDLFLSVELLTPGEFRAGAHGLDLAWDVVDTPFGSALLAASERGLCGVSFVERGEAERELRARWPEARLRREPRKLAEAASALRARMSGRLDRPLALVLKGTPLQLKVWQALLQVPAGQVATYADVARLAGAPSAVRAVASAVGQNALAYLIPCHRVIRATGAVGEYRWGSARKAALLAYEQAHLDNGAQ